MTGNNDYDDDLRARFTELRREEEARAPEFAFPPRTWAEQGRRWPAGKLIAGAVCLVTMAAAVFLLRIAPQAPDRNRHTVASITEWRSPTDFLLQTPGRELLRTVPSIGVWHSHTTASKPGAKHSHGK
jgi:hypothetical protein